MRLTDQTLLDEDYRYCEDIIKQNSKSFYFAFLGLPKAKANAVYAIYAFCRIADDSVDLGGTRSEKINALNRIYQELSLFQDEKELDHPLWRALRDVFTRYKMDIQPFFDQLKGQRRDIDFTIPQTMSQVEEYSYYVAGTVGLMLLPIIASESEQDLTQQAISLGVAMQITNILRDVGEDYRKNNRIYLPLYEMESESYTEEDIKQARINIGFIRIWEKMASRAEALFDDFQEVIKYFDKDSRFQVLLSARLYRGILNAVRDNEYDCFFKRNFISPMEMQQIQQETKVFASAST
ncbi:phytoene/squalene synthase family protein [Bacillus sp. mrc49]|uniref:phytoene/squalene synthase family protein n=1 Tax=Bacillus sp. mrc49 TaxID=2054913 RepID=UPI000C26FD86|nr:phytoene/squalene synthase family protein [Bacillus sp. mrc49]PJN90087.1 phytoene synthase [Bacillus sp. mrc49]